jgi:hypothetical protein
MVPSVAKRSTEPVYKTADKNRIPIPISFCEAVALAPSTEPIEVLLWMVTAGRYRLIAGNHVDHPGIKGLLTRILERDGPKEPTDFEDDASTVLNVRLVEAKLSFVVRPSSSGKEWRLSLPDILVDVLKIRKEGQAVVVLDGQFIEIWSVQTFEAALKVPASDPP